MIFSSKFIKANDAICDFNNHVPAPYMRPEFDLPFSPEKAEITICGLGFYELYINGKNVIGILLGNGFRNPFGGFVWDFHIAACRGPVAVAFALEAFAGEETFLLEADETVKTHPSPITFNEIRMGCRYDARLEIPNWAELDFDDKNWESAMPAQMPAGIQKLCKADPIVITDRRSPVFGRYLEYGQVDVFVCKGDLSLRSTRKAGDRMDTRGR